MEKDHSVNVGAIKVIGLSAVLKMRSCSFGFGWKPESDVLVSRQSVSNIIMY